MHVPSRVLYGGSSGAPVALIAATAAVTFLFTATPFLLTPISDRYGVSEGTASAIAVAQVGSFAITNFLLPRLVRPNGRILRIAAIGVVVTNALSMLPNQFVMLIVLRVAAGAAAGAMTWLAWSNAMKRTSTMSSIAATGPVTALIAAPLLSLIATHGDRVVYGALALVAVPAAVLIAPITGKKRSRGDLSRSRSNRVLLAALFGLTFFGSSLYLNLSIVARDIHHLTPFAASFGFSLNAVGSLMGARLSSRLHRPGWFMISIGIAAAGTVLGPVPLYYFGMFWWGFAFWIAVPNVLQLLVDRSLEPSERAGDGQGVMALGRSFGPAMGGGFVDAGAFSALAIVSASGLAVSGLTVIGVNAGRERFTPTDPGTIDQQF